MKHNPFVMVQVDDSFRPALRLTDEERRLAEQHGFEPVEMYGCWVLPLGDAQRDAIWSRFQYQLIDDIELADVLDTMIEVRDSDTTHE